MSDESPAQITDPDLAELSHKTGLVIRTIDSVANRLFKDSRDTTQKNELREFRP